MMMAVIVVGAVMTMRIMRVPAGGDRWLQRPQLIFRRFKKGPDNSAND